MRLIQSEHWRLWSDPGAGVQWFAGEINRAGQWHAILPESRPGSSGKGARAGQDEKAPLAASSFYMIPYSNRIRDARFEFNQQVVQLEHANKHAIHGAMRKLPWDIVHHDDNSLHCEFDSRQKPDINWPWPIRASIKQSVEGDTLISSIAITNHGTSDMPVGTGWHPYFVREIAGSHATLTLPVDGVFPDAAGDCLPDGGATELPRHLDFRQSRLLDPSQRIDVCLSGLSGDCVLDWRDAGIKLTLSASDNCRYLVLFNPDMPHFAVEPVTNANDAFNLHSQGIESGTQVLEPEQTLDATMRMIISVTA